jgi:outer membrane protein
MKTAFVTTVAVAGALSTVAGVAFAQTPVPAPAPAAAPAARPAPTPVLSQVVVFDLQGVIAQSDAGKDMAQKVNAIATAMRNELEPEARTLEADRQRLPQTPAAQLQATEEALRRRLQAFAQKQERLAAELQLTRDNAFNAYLNELNPLLVQAMTARNALVVLESGSTYANVPGVDISADLVARLNAKTRTINVTRATLPAQGAAPAAGARPATPAAPGAARPATPAPAAAPRPTPVPAPAPLPRAPATPRPN